MQKAYIENDTQPCFSKLLSEISKQQNNGLFASSALETVLNYFDGLQGEEGFIFNHYTPEGTCNLEIPRMYFSGENGQKIDAIRQKIEHWRQEELIGSQEYYILIASLIEIVSFYPDLVLIDLKNSESITVEGKTYQNRQKGIEKLENYKSFERFYVKQYYPKFKIIRTVVLYGSKQKKPIEIEVGFLLNENGEMALGVRAPKLFGEAIANLLDYFKR